MDDLISRQAAIDALNKQIQQCRKALGSLSLSDVDKHAVEVKMASLRAYRKKLENLPTIQPEPHEGRFERKQDGVFCSVCHYGWEFITGVPAEVEREYHYCPNCGADMRGEKDE